MVKFVSWYVLKVVVYDKNDNECAKEPDGGGEMPYIMLVVEVPRPWITRLIVFPRHCRRLPPLGQPGEEEVQSKPPRNDGTKQVQDQNGDEERRVPLIVLEAHNDDVEKRVPQIALEEFIYLRTDIEEQVEKHVEDHNAQEN